MHRTLQFLNDEQGQDLIEYTLLIAFVALASAALFMGAGGSISTIWTATNRDSGSNAPSMSFMGQAPACAGSSWRRPGPALPRII